MVLKIVLKMNALLGKNTEKSVQKIALSAPLRRASSLKIVAYCATVAALAGCAGLNSATPNSTEKSPVSVAMSQDTLAFARVQSRAQLIPSLEAAQALELSAVDKQSVADKQTKSNAAACYKKFLVNRCLDKLRNTRNDAWDDAQIDRSAARLYIRTKEAENSRVALMAKMNDYSEKEAANAPQRAANVAKFNQKRIAQAVKLATPQSPTPEQRAINRAAFEAKQKAYAEKWAQEPKLNAQTRADNVEKFEEKVSRLEALKKKRIADNKARTAKAAKKSVDDAAKAAAQRK